MTARMPTRPRVKPCLALLVLPAMAILPGCQTAGRHAEKHIPQYGVIDPTQPKELEMVSHPPYVVEPPDELEISVRPAILDVPITTATVQIDGVADLGFAGDVYVAGLTLAQIETKLAQLMTPLARERGSREPVQVSVRLVNGSQSKSYYVLGTVSTQGKFPLTGNETVLDAILQAGLRTNSLPEKAYLVRPHPAGHGEQVLKIDWVGIKERGDTTTNYQIFPGDRIVVPGGKPPGLLSTLLGGG